MNRSLACSISVMLVLMLASYANAQTIAFAQLALGGGYESVLIISNQVDSAWRGTAKLFTGNRQPWEGAWSINGIQQVDGSQFNLSLNPNETVKYTVAGDGVVRGGYLTLEGEPGFSAHNISVSYFYNVHDAAGQLVSTTGHPASEFGSGFVIPVEKSPTVDTGIAWVGKDSRDTFLLKLYDSQGIEADEKTIVIEGYFCKFFTEIFDLGGSEHFIGSIIIDGGVSSPLEGEPSSAAIAVLRMEHYSPSGFLLTSVPAVPYTQDTRFPSDLITICFLDGLTVHTDAFANANNKTVFQGEYRAKFTSKAVDFVDLSSDSDIEIVKDANQFGASHSYNAKQPGRVFFQWRFQNKIGWSPWSPTRGCETEY
ncbi:MAG: hypothetical protein H6Q04_1371 [Acidobacteria bacterium]|nr:hypothetical protein [Acidobacteriota bacterium]